MKNKKHIFKLIGLSIFSVILLCFVLEIGLRIYDPFRMKERRLYEKMIKEKGYFSAQNKKDSLFREPLPDAEKEPGEFRILVLGDSFSWGDGITEVNNTWPSILERLLNEKVSGMHVNVVNLGVCGFTTVNEMELLVNIGNKLNPDMIILQFYINDILPSGPGYMRLGSDWLYTRKPKNIITDPKTHKLFLERSYLYKYLNFRYVALQLKIWPAKEWKDLYSDKFGGFRDFAKALKAIAYLGRKNDDKLIFVSFPVFLPGKWNKKQYPYFDIYTVVENYADTLGFEVIDLLRYYVYEKTNLIRWRVSMDNAHPNVNANIKAASLIAKYLLQGNFIK